ncbi:MAG: type IV pilus assembly protein PilM [Acidobacteriota bacterium]
MSILTHLKPKTRNLIGVDIGSSTVKVAGLKPFNGSYELDTLAIEHLPQDSIADGAIISKIPVAEAIEKIFKAHNIKNNRIATSISGHSVIVKKVTLPAQSVEELDESIQWEAEQYIPFDISDVNLDYQIVRRIPETNKIEVILVAAKRDKITEHTSVVSMAGKHPSVVDIDAFALQNVYEFNYEPDTSTVAALLDIGSATMSINIVKGNEFLFTRDIAMGGHHYTDFLQKEFRVPFSEAENYKRGDAPTEELRARVQKVLDSVSEILTLEIQKTFDYFRTTVYSEEIREIYLSGGASRSQGLREFLKKNFQIPVEFLNPFKRIRTENGDFTPDALNEMAADFGIAIGLALRTAKDR